MNINRLISSNIDAILDLEFQKIYEFIEEKYLHYDKCFASEMNQAYDNNTDFFTILDIKNKKHLSFLFKLMLLFDKYILTKAFLGVFNFLERNDIELSGVLKALKIANSTNDILYAKENFNIFIKELNFAYESEEDPEKLNYILKRYIFSELQMSQHNKDQYNNLIYIFKGCLIPQNSFLDIDFFNDFLKDALESDKFIDNWKEKIKFFNKKVYKTDFIINERYKNTIENIKNISFDDILRLCYNELKGKGVQNTTNHGKKLLESDEELMDYIRRYGDMHKEKLIGSFKKIKDHLEQYDKINIIDYACGQAMATLNLVDFIKNNDLKCKIEEVILIEPSQNALARAVLHSKCFLPNSKISFVPKYLNDLVDEDLSFKNPTLPTLQLFSNILDMEEVKLNNDLYSCISSSLSLKNIFVCVSPRISSISNNRLDIFYMHFKEYYQARQISNESYGREQRGHTKYEQIFEVIK